ncbi:hypothetical protein BH10PAT2_BH10PAT2_1920 [soil metagenome]
MSPYTVRSVEYATNTSPWTNAAPTDGAFDSILENYFFDFNPNLYRAKLANNQEADGYTIQVKSTNTNLDQTDHLFYFQPFTAQSPASNTVVTSPQFAFSVHKDVDKLRNNLAKYQIQIKRGESDSGAAWSTLVDDIPVSGPATDYSGTEDKDLFLATYTDLGSSISVTPRSSNSSVTPSLFSGLYQWKAVAVDKAGHTEDSNTQSFFMIGDNNPINSAFPLSLTNISGFGNPHMSTYYPLTPAKNYFVSSVPIFYGIAWANSSVTLLLTDQNCQTDCVQTFSTITNQAARFGINVPKGTLKSGSKYTAKLPVILGENYNQLPPFTISIGK